jgi:asparagine synthase (glutamine-hydrolysing)
MCGISGFATPDPNAAIDRQLLENMTDLLTHRGPDGSGFLVGPGVGLGMRRLSIVDLETGDQPIGSEDGRIQVVCNGEIYNSPELIKELKSRGHRLKGHSDVEVIVHLYEEMGLEVLQRLRGMFAIALWDEPRRRLILARDRFGIKPLYYAKAQDGTLFFASEAKSILLTGKIDPSLDPRGLTGILDMGGPLFDRTTFKGVRQLMPGHWLMYQAGAVNQGRYWDLDFTPRNRASLPKGEGEWAEAIGNKLREAVRLHLLGDVPMAAWLSPGVDSSAVAFHAIEELGQRLTTFSLGFDDPRFDELESQKTLDQYPGFDVTGDRVSYVGTFLAELPQAIWHEEQPVTFQTPYRILGGAMEGRLKVALTGQGSDEMLGGYPWYRIDQMWKSLYRLPSTVRKLLARVAPRISDPDRRAIATAPEMSWQRLSELQWTRWAELKTLFQPELAEQIRTVEETLEMPILPDGFRKWDRFHQLMYVEAKTRLVSFINRGLDAEAMARSVEPRLPFLDHEFAELAGLVPPELRHKRMEKHILRKAVEQHLPEEITWRRKRGVLSPAPTWKPEWGKMPEFARDVLADEVVREKGYFRPEAVQRMVRDVEGLNGPLAAVVGFHLWDEQFVRGKGSVV